MQSLAHEKRRMHVVDEKSLLAEAISKARSGDKAGARGVLKDVCRLNPNNEQALLWRASLAETVAEGTGYLEHILSINPANQVAAGWLAKLRPAPPEPEPEPAFTCAFCSHESDKDFDRCAQCKAIVSADDIDAFAANAGVDERQLRHAIEYFEKHEERNTYEVQYHLGVANLNLLRSQQALTHLKAASALNPAETELRNRIDQLLQRRLVLVVDDSATVRGMVARELEKERYRTVAAGSGADALAALAEHQIDLVLLDVSMPQMDGYQVCKLIKDSPRTKRTPVVMLSGNDGFLDKVRGRMAGASDYLTKPFQTATVLGVVKKHAPKRDAR